MTDFDEIEPEPRNGPVENLEDKLGRAPTNKEVNKYYKKKFKRRYGDGRIRHPEYVEEHTEFNKEIPGVVRLTAPIQARL